MTDTFRRQVRFDPGHTIRRTKGDGSDYGIASMQIRFLLHGEHGTTQFALFSGWYPEKVPVPGRSWTDWHHTAPAGLDLGAHWDTPWSEYMTEEDGAYAHRECDMRASGMCWYDGSSLRADEFMETFFREGDDAVWTLLENEYRTIDIEAAELRQLTQTPKGSHA